MIEHEPEPQDEWRKNIILTPEEIPEVKEVIQQDDEKGLLAFTTTNEEHKFQPYPNYCAWILGRDGKPLDRIHNKGFKTLIRLNRETLYDIYIENYGPDTYGIPGYSEVVFCLGEDLDDQLFGKQYHERGGTFHGWKGNRFSRSIYIECEIYRNRIDQNPVAVLTAVCFGIVFDGLEDNGKFEANSPFIVLTRNKPDAYRENPTLPESRELYVSSTAETHPFRNGYNFSVSAKERNAIFANRDKNLVYNVDWTLENGILTLRQTQKEGPKKGAIKILTTPVLIDLNPLTSSLLVTPPYTKNEHGQYNIPWRGLDRKFGLRISYSYPPPNNARTRT